MGPVLYNLTARNGTWPSYNEFGQSSCPENLRKLFQALCVFPCSSSVRIDLKQNLGNSGREEKVKFSPDCEQLM